MEKAVTEKKLFQIADQGELHKALRYCMLLVGMRADNFPGKEESGILIAHIHKYYQGHTISEIRLAFEMAIAGELDLELSDVKAYENFSPMYFSLIMNSYRRWSAQEYRQVIKEPPPPQKIFTDQEIENLQRKEIEEAYQLMRTGKVPYGLPEYFKPQLVKDGLMNQEENLNVFFVQRLGKQIENIYLPIN